ncbi:hypothetical protein DPMN_169555 [Dreissena polymorpha]|uniref:Uncharacterized protein n=1 Tax=Dreissena polymorpha TaxID=45954 RepID=A0A9D4DW88_DREPO|nr:hypothetical protein DPMN_169555 [Dreissena polymorpha]
MNGVLFIPIRSTVTDIINRSRVNLLFKEVRGRKVSGFVLPTLRIQFLSGIVQDQGKKDYIIVFQKEVCQDINQRISNMMAPPTGLFFKQIFAVNRWSDSQCRD